MKNEPNNTHIPQYRRVLEFIINTNTTTLSFKEKFTSWQLVALHTILSMLGKFLMHIWSQCDGLNEELST
jgi:hypothetical protein